MRPGVDLSGRRIIKKKMDCVGWCAGEVEGGSKRGCGGGGGAQGVVGGEGLIGVVGVGRRGGWGG
eukprot:COSAG06_NODE_44948_length_359_cov_0.484615_1_plen_65_part_00